MGRDEWTSAPMKSATVFDEFDKRHSSIENKLLQQIINSSVIEANKIFQPGL